MSADYNRVLIPIRKAQGSHYSSNSRQPLQGQPTKIRQVWIDLLPKTNGNKKQNLVTQNSSEANIKSIKFLCFIFDFISGQRALIISKSLIYEISF